ncbi:MAG: cell wall-binding repeat-containing protein [Chloroflexi bacterium]|nr:cell wall-binding repeat-containing protein [Chloroflexota bacterium]
MTSVVELPFDAYVSRALAARWPASTPPAALEIGAIVTRQAAWYLAMHGHEGYMLANGTCYDARDDAIDLVLADSSAVLASHVEALAATASLTLRKTAFAEPFFLPLVHEGSDDTGSAGPVSPHPIVPRRGVIACALAGQDARAILHRYLDPGLTIVDATEIGGPSRYDTAVAASRAAVPVAPAGTVFIATGLDYADALAGGPAAAKLGGSLLLVPGTSVPSAVAAELKRLQPAAIRVLGGPTVVSDGVLTVLRAYSPDVARVSGPSRYETAIATSRAAFGPGTTTVFVATGANFPDALAGASAAASIGAPVLLVPGIGAPREPFASALAAELRRLAPATIHVLGSSAVVSAETLAWLEPFAPTVDRLAGTTRYETAAAIAAAIYPAGIERLIVATGDNFPDALAAAPLRGPLLLVSGSGAWPAAAVTAEAHRLGAAQIVVLGANSVVPDLAVTALTGAAPPPPSGRLLERYFCTALPGTPILDGQGIPMTVYAGKAQYNPVQVSQFGLAQFERWLRTGDEADRATFLRMADWLVATQKSTGLWHYTFAYGGQPIPWWSGMAQGQAVSLLVRAFQETGMQAYRNAAALAVPTMRRTIPNGGTATIDGGRYWIQEYIPPYSRDTLNGFMFSIVGLDEWIATTGDPTAASWRREALGTLVARLPRFDTGHWSYYNLSPPPGSTLPGQTASIKYHVIHVIQLRHLASVSRDPVLRTFATRWAAYAASPPAGVH